MDLGLKHNFSGSYEEAATTQGRAIAIQNFHQGTTARLAEAAEAVQQFAKAAAEQHGSNISGTSQALHMLAQHQADP